MKKGPLVVWVFVGDEILTSYVGIVVNHYQDHVLKPPSVFLSGYF